jgi:hypothetical protein
VLDCAKIRFVHVHPKMPRHQLFCTYLLLFGFTIFFVSPDYSMDGIVDQARITVTEKNKLRAVDLFRERHNRPVDLAFIISASGLSFIASLSLLRFDFKQNLRTWPVLATGIQRSPPRD